MKTFKNADFKKRSYDCTNIVFAQADEMPEEGNWIECDEKEIDEMRCSPLGRWGGVRYLGYL